MNRKMIDLFVLEVFPICFYLFAQLKKKRTKFNLFIIVQLNQQEKKTEKKFNFDPSTNCLCSVDWCCYCPFVPIGKSAPTLVNP